MAATPPRSARRPFRPRARMMHLLGDQLIRDAGIGLVELVKNAYDADATRCRVALEGVERDGDEARIVVEDDGHGMDLETVVGVWLEPGTDHRKAQKERGGRSRKFGRVPLGEKGVGRFAVHKLGRRVRMVTRRSRRREVVVTIDWRRFSESKYLEEIPIDVSERAPEVFRGRRSGTRIEVWDLRDRPWNRARVQAVHRAVQSIRSPFAGPDGFVPEIAFDGPEDWLEGLLDPEEVLAQAPFRFRARLSADRLSYTYRFEPRGAIEGVEAREVKRREIPVRLRITEPGTRTKVLSRVDLSRFRIGPVEVDLHLFDRDSRILRLTSSDPVGLGLYLDRSGGIRVFRDGVRVYDYGEPGNDWLELGARRLQVPARRVSNNQVVGAVHLSLADSADLVEKTNREGFVENEALEAFRRAMIFLVAQVEAERSVDKSRIRRRLSQAKAREPVVEELAALRVEIERLGLEEELGPHVGKIETQYREVVDRLLMAAGTGLNLAALLHEVERMIRDLEGLLVADAGFAAARRLARSIGETLDGLTWLTRRGGRTAMPARALVRQALANCEYRLRGHGVEAVDGTAGDAGPAFDLVCDRRLVTAALMNLIDNSLHWLEEKGGKKRRLYVGASYEPAGRPGLVVADNGPGFVDPADELVQPFFTRKPDGMGLGLHIVDEVMKAHGGRLLFPSAGEIALPRGLGGAVLVLEFPSPDEG